MTEVVTGEAVVLDLAVARFPSRMLALMIDIAVQLPVLIFLAIVVSSGSHINSASGAAIYLAGFMFVVIGYPVIFETLSRGKTLGKLALGLRVVCDDGSPERFRQALIRAPVAGLRRALAAAVQPDRDSRRADHLDGVGEGQAAWRPVRRDVRDPGARAAASGPGAGLHGRARRR